MEPNPNADSNYLVLMQGIVEDEDGVEVEDDIFMFAHREPALAFFAQLKADPTVAGAALYQRIALHGAVAVATD